MEPPQAVVLGVRAAGRAELDVFALARHVEAARQHPAAQAPDINETWYEP